jgi:asparagine synthase (glutamine-hydrolysing)
MCGITGFVDYNGIDAPAAEARVRAMNDAIAHRGPDGEGVWVNETGHVAIAQRRLAIIDLSETGRQPMTSPGGRYEIVFNGEIYGFQSLRLELEALGASFRGHSDTEVLLAAIEQWDVAAALTKVGGMFAFALVDRAENRIIFARDRIGKKPLYIGLNDNVLTFGSELKALRAHPSQYAPSLNLRSVGAYVRYGYVPAPETIYDGIIKLPAGSWAELSLDAPPGSVDDVLTAASPFWRPYDVAADGVRDVIRDESAAIDLLDERICTATRERLVSDVPVGAFLSGGIDSSLVTAVMQEVSTEKARTFTIRFDETETNEADFAAAIASHLDTQHTEVTATPDAALDMFADMPEVFDEPFADPSQIPTLLLSRLTREHVTVALSGDGGDESFAGYKRYQNMLLFEKIANKAPSALFAGLEGMPTPAYGAALAVGKSLLPKSLQQDASAHRMKALAHVLAEPDFRGRYNTFFSLWDRPEALIPALDAAPCPFLDANVPAGFDAVQEMMFLDTVIYLPDDVLVKVDRASMAVGLEMRSPLLDHRVIEAAWRAPSSLRLKGRSGKIALRRLLEKRVPLDLFDRPKQGFGIPVNDWLRGPLKERASQLLSSSHAKSVGLFDPSMITHRWSEHLSGERNWGAHLWTLIMFYLWHERWMAR